MKNIKRFENLEKYFNPNDHYIFEDEYLQIEKISYGPNDGKIQFRFYDENTHSYIWKCSMMYGCAKLINTEYETYPEIQEIKIGNKKFRKVQHNTIESVLIDFLKRIGYPDMNELDSCVVRYGDKIKNIAENAKNLGDVLHEFRKIYNELKFENDANKYNL